MIRCPRCSEDNPPRARFCLNCGQALGRADQDVTAEERRVVTAVFIDLVGSTALAESADPEDVRARLVPYHDRVRRELERHGGTVEKFIGDAVVAIFGAPVANEDDPERAVRASFAVRDGVAALNDADAWLALTVRIGVCTGESLVRLGARLAEGESLAMGDVMNTAARIQSAAPPGGILVSLATRRATSHAVDYAEHEPLTAKGKAEPVQVSEAVALRAARHRRRSDAPFVGREDELAELRSLWDGVVAARRPASAFLVAEPGIGKTRLLAAFADDAGVEALWGRCLPYGEGGAYGPVGEILAAVGVDRILADAEDSELRTLTAAVDAVLGAGSVSEITRGELHWGIRRALELVTRDGLVVIFEDLHWAEPGLLELVDFLRAGSFPLLLLCTARPGGPDLGADLLLELAPLSVDDSRALVNELLGGLAEDAPLEPVVAAAHGNPLYLEETVHMLADEGFLSGSTPPDRLPAPPSLTSMIGARLDRLPDQERHLALRAAVLGSSFWPGAVTALDGISDVERGLEALTVLDVAEKRPVSTVSGEREFAFKHDLIREVAYGRLPKGLRVQLHVRSADWLVAHQERDELVEMGAFHLEQACKLAREIERSPVAPPVLEAAAALTTAAEKAERREGLEEADRFYVRALELVVDEEHPESAAELRLGRARVLAAAGKLEDATERFRSVAADAAGLGRRDLRGAALVGLGNALQKQGSPDEAHTYLLEAKSIAEEIGDRILEVRSLFELAEIDRDFRGEVPVAVETLEHALELAASFDDRRLLAEGNLRLGFVLNAAGRLADAERALGRSAAIGAELDSRRDESRATFLRAWTAYHLGRPGEAERLALEAQEWFQRTGDRYFLVQNLRALAQYAFARGDPAAAANRLEEALLIEQDREGWLSSGMNADLAEVLVALGRLDEARERAAIAVTTAPDDDPAARASAWVASACVSAASGDRERTMQQAEDALAISEQLGNSLEVGRVRIVLARALAAVGERDEASRQLERAAAECARIGAVTLENAAREALAGLG